MSIFRPPPDADRCHALVLYGGQRGRCRAPRVDGSDLCAGHLEVEDAGGEVRRVPEPAKEGR
jgi:hypothetical protein